MPALVLKKFRLDSSYTGTFSERLIVELVGREAGFLDFLLGILGLQPHTILRSYDDRMEFSQHGVFGQWNYTIPACMVEAVFSVFVKPIEYLVIAVALFVGSVPVGAALAQEVSQQAAIGGVGLLLLLAIIMFVKYFTGIRMGLYVQLTGSHLYGLYFRSGLIEGVKVDRATIDAAVLALNAVVMKSHRR